MPRGRGEATVGDKERKELWPNTMTRNQTRVQAQVTGHLRTVRDWSLDEIRFVLLLGVPVVSSFRMDQVTHSNKEPKLSVAQDEGLFLTSTREAPFQK